MRQLPTLDGTSLEGSELPFVIFCSKDFESIVEFNSLEVSAPRKCFLRNNLERGWKLDGF